MRTCDPVPAVSVMLIFVVSVSCCVVLARQVACDRMCVMFWAHDLAPTRSFGVER